MFFLLEVNARSTILKKLLFKEMSYSRESFLINLIKLEVTFGLISKASGGTSNKISLSKKRAIFIASFPQFFVDFCPVIYSATSRCTKKCISSINS